MYFSFHIFLQVFCFFNNGQWTSWGSFWVMNQTTLLQCMKIFWLKIAPFYSIEFKNLNTLTMQTRADNSRDSQHSVLRCKLISTEDGRKYIDQGRAQLISYSKFQMSSLWHFPSLSIISTLLVYQGFILHSDRIRNTFCYCIFELENSGTIRFLKVTVSDHCNELHLGTKELWSTHWWGLPIHWCITNSFPATDWVHSML